MGTWNPARFVDGLKHNGQIFSWSQWVFCIARHDGQLSSEMVPWGVSPLSPPTSF